MVKKTKRPYLDDPLFRQEMADVVPLKTRQTTASRPPRKPAPERHRDVPTTAYAPARPDPKDVSAHEASDDGSSYRKEGIQLRTMQKLKRGRFRVAAELDLHNMTVETARSVLLDFIAEARSGSMEAVRIIHGKGLRSDNGPRLMQMTRQVLREHPLVRAYTSCKPSDGGSGAVDVLLKMS